MPPRRSSRVPVLPAATKQASGSPASSRRVKASSTTVKVTPKTSPYFEHRSDSEGDSAEEQDDLAKEETASSKKGKGGWGWSGGRDKKTAGGWGWKHGRGKKDHADDEPDEEAEPESKEKASAEPKKKGGWGWAGGRDKKTAGGWGWKNGRGQKDASEEAPSETAEESDDDHSDYNDVSPPPPPKKTERRGKRKHDDSSENEKPTPKRRGRPPKKRAATSDDNDDDDGPAITTKAKELWREGVKTGLGPGKEIIIKKPRARSPGGTKYTGSTVHPNTMLFLSDLKKNNDREWLKAHDPDFRQAENDWKTFVEKLTEKVIESDETIPELPPKDVVFRIYRDIRFTSDPTPYKPYFSAAWSRTGRKGPYAAYYVQIQPGASFVGSGLWHPEASRLALMRADINEHSEDLKEVLTDAKVRKEFLGGIPNDEKKAVQAFIKGSSEDALKTRPKGYDPDNANIDLLRLRSFTIGRKLKDEEVIGPKALQRIAELIGILTPFVTYLNGIVMPDD